MYEYSTHLNSDNFILNDRETHEDIQDVINTNLFGLVVCTREAYKILKRTDDYGYIININSVVGHQVLTFPIPQFDIYPATKFAVTATTEVVRQELNYLKNKKVRVAVSYQI